MVERGEVTDLVGGLPILSVIKDACLVVGGW